MNRIYVLFCLLFLGADACAQKTYTRQELTEDFDGMWSTVQEQYGYWPEKKTDWACVRARYRPALDSIRTREGFIALLEQVLRELYDQHVGLNTNTAASFRLVPSGADIALRLEGDKAIVTEVRPRSGAERAGIRADMELVGINGQDWRDAVKPLLPKCLKAADPAAQLYALQLLAAGTHRDARRLKFADGLQLRSFAPDSFVNIDTLRDAGLLESRVLPGNVGYICIHNSLGDDDLIPAFDSALNKLMGTRGLVFDLRQTPGGGTSTVARAMMGRLLQRAGYYQLHELPSDAGIYGVKRSWAEIVSPRGTAYTKPVAVLAGAWTGSMGEGIVVGLHALGRAQVFGHPMAGLNGAIYSFSMPHTGIGYNISAERVYHMDGKPRENFRAINAGGDADQTLRLAVRFLETR